jgi:hypothetical protein
MRQFTQKNIQDPFELNNDINIMTRATITSRAITQAIKISLDKLSGEFPYIQTIAKKQNSHFSLGDILLPCILFLSAIGGFLLKKKALRVSSRI